MIINISDEKSKTKVLADRYKTFLSEGVSASKILVILPTKKAKDDFLNAFYKDCSSDVLERLRINTFGGLVYNTVSDNWGFLENKIPDDKAVILPNNTGLEPSQYILKNIIKDLKFEGYNSKRSLLHQLFRRYSLIVQNNLSENQVAERSKILKESFSKDAENAMKLLGSKTLNYRAFDYIRQIQIFNYIYKNTDYF